MQCCTSVLYAAVLCLSLCVYYAANTRAIAVPMELEHQLYALFAKSQTVQKHSKLWMMSAARGRVDTILSQDYRNIVEGLQVEALFSLCLSLNVIILHFFKNQIQRFGCHHLENKIFSYFSNSLCLQCFDAVGWAAGRASGL